MKMPPNSFVLNADAGYALTYVMSEADPAEGSFGLTHRDVPVVLLQNMAEVTSYLDSEVPEEQKRVIREGVHKAAEQCHNGKLHGAAIAYLQALIPRTPALEERAGYLLDLGISLENVSDFAYAARAYREGTILEPTGPNQAFLLQNNLGYCLNQLGRHTEAEIYCRAAIRIAPQRYNAHKNLGLARLAQGHALEAARHLTHAAMLDPTNRRSFDHLTEVFLTHPGLLAQDTQMAEMWEKLKHWWEPALD